MCTHNNEPSSTLLDSKICYCNSLGNYHAEYMMDKMNITILDYLYQNLNFKTYRQV